MRVETAIKLVYAVQAVAFTGFGVYFLYGAHASVGEGVWEGVGYLLLGVGWTLLLVRASRSSGS